MRHKATTGPQVRTKGGIIPISNKAYGGWGGIFGNAPTAAALMGRPSHQARITGLNGTT
jgi:hypothetical protein